MDDSVHFFVAGHQSAAIDAVLIIFHFEKLKVHPQVFDFNLSIRRMLCGFYSSGMQFHVKLFLNEKSVKKRFQFFQWRMSMGMENGRRRQAEWAAVNQQFLSHAIWSRPVSFRRMQMDGTNSTEQASDALSLSVIYTQSSWWARPKREADRFVLGAIHHLRDFQWNVVPLNAFTDK